MIREAFSRNTKEGQLSRRQLLRGASTAAFAAFTLDQLSGWWDGRQLRDDPEIEVHLNPESERTILVAGGLANDGIIAARAMRHALGRLGNVIGLRYAETNMSPRPIQKLIARTLQTYNLDRRRVSAYLNSAAGIFMAEPIRLLKQENSVGYDVFAYDDSPSGDADVREPQRSLLQLTSLRYSKAGDILAGHITDWDLPPATDHSKSTPPQLAAAHRQAMIDTPLITLGVQAEQILECRPEPGSMRGIAGNNVFVHARHDPLVITGQAMEGWGYVCGGVDPYEDQHLRPDYSHAAGVVYPGSIVHALRRMES